MHHLARFTVHYGDELRFAGDDLPPPERISLATRYGSVPAYLHRGSRPGHHVHLHGGAFLMRHPRMDDFWCRYLVATTGVSVVNVDFRAGPYVATRSPSTSATTRPRRWPRGVARCRWAASPPAAGWPPPTCLQARDAGSFRPVLQVLGVPALDLASPVDPHGGMISPQLRGLVRRVYFPDPATRSEPYASPLLADDLTGLPPAVVLTAERDSLRPDGERWAAAAARGRDRGGRGPDARRRPLLPQPRPAPRPADDGDGGRRDRPPAQRAPRDRRSTRQRGSTSCAISKCIGSV